MTTYKAGLNAYALYLHKGVWKESASVKNSDLDKLQQKAKTK